MNKPRISCLRIVVVQGILVGALTASYAVTPKRTHRDVGPVLPGESIEPTVPVERSRPLRIAPLHDEPQIVSDADLAAVLRRIRPPFQPDEQLSPNHVEHALRTWDVDATFDDPEIMSGAEMRDFLLDHRRYAAVWGEEIDPLLQERPTGVRIRWGREEGASYHHDHLLACLSEAGVRRDFPVRLPSGRKAAFGEVLQQALHDFRLDQRETEWSAMAFGLWLPPTNSWISGQGRFLSFDRMAERLLRGHKRYGVCSGTHRLYSLMLLLRLDERFSILSVPVRSKVRTHLESVRELLIASQFDDGRWPSNWSDGEAAVSDPIDDSLSSQVIATGHHLEWLAIAPEELHPPQKQIARAADWVIEQTRTQSEETLRDDYTFYSHVANALALWRGTRPTAFWQQWRRQHAETPSANAAE